MTKQIGTPSVPPEGTMTMHGIDSIVTRRRFGDIGTVQWTELRFMQGRHCFLSFAVFGESPSKANPPLLADDGRALVPGPKGTLPSGTACCECGVRMKSGEVCPSCELAKPLQQGVTTFDHGVDDIPALWEGGDA